MIKYISIFQLKQDYDPEETYQMWLKEHVPYVKKVMKPELEGYIVGRVVESMTEGSQFFGTVQLSYRNLEDCKKAWARLQANRKDEFMRRITNIRKVIIEERDVFD
jgi:hypothetical protein